MLSSFLAVLIVAVRSSSIFDFECSVDQTDCSALSTFMVEMNAELPEEDRQPDAVLGMITPKCNTADSFCSIDCGGFNLCGTLGPLIGIDDFYCDDVGKYCTVDLTCGSDTDCVIEMMGKCSSAGACIADASNDCTTNTDCTTAGLGFCDERTYSGVTVKFCAPEKCTQASECITANFLCGASGFCVPPCTTAGADGCAKSIYDASGLLCDTTTGICAPPPSASPTQQPSVNPTISTADPSVSPTISTADPSVSPTNNPSVNPTISTADPSVSPTNNPSVNPTIRTNNPSANPTTSTGDSGDDDDDEPQGGNANKYGVFGALVVMTVITVWT
eukprot:1062291_1